MILKYSDFRGADIQASGGHQSEWEELQDVLSSLNLHLKASDQAGIQGKPIFDVVGTNEHIKLHLQEKNWSANVKIPKEFEFLGTDFDFSKNGVIVEAQFSNYPFLMNNVLRAQLFFKSKTPLLEEPTSLVIIITKAHMFPASNSTLYYEQGAKQLAALAKYQVFDVPIRLVGLFESLNSEIVAKWSEYENPRYSRTPLFRTNRRCRIRAGANRRSRAQLELL